VAGALSDGVGVIALWVGDGVVERGGITFHGVHPLSDATSTRASTARHTTAMQQE
jgi:hypothetical protein